MRAPLPRPLRIQVLATVLLTATAGALGAQACDDPARFLEATSRHRQELADLRATRGMPIPLPGEMPLDRVTELLGDHYGQADSTIGILMYAVDGERLSVWLVSARGLAGCADVEDATGPISRSSAELQAALGVEAGSNQLAARHRGLTPPPSSGTVSLDAAVTRLTDLLLPGAIRESLGAFPALIVVPVRAIGTVPFAMLRPFSPDSILAERASIAVAPSLYDVFQDVEGWHRPRTALVVGNPAYAPHPDFILPPLPGAEEEARQVAATFATTPLTGGAATKQQVLASATGRAPDVLYFATHGVADPADPLDGSFLALAPGDGDDGRWTAREIQSAPLRGAQLAVLSACQTGLGATHDAGIIGLARAFQLAGVPRVVVSLWNVDDAATTAFMAALARAVVTDSPNDALQRTILGIRERYPDPRVWAAFVLFGTVK